MLQQPLRAALYARVSTDDQTCENQLRDLREYCLRRGWASREYVDQAVSGIKERRPALDAMLQDARRRRIDCVVVWRLDRLGRNLRHLITTLDELTALERLVAHSQADLSEETIHAHFVDESPQTISRAQPS